jgi:hypothetical protein
MVVGYPIHVFIPIEIGSNVPFTLDDDVIMPRSSFLPFPVPNPFTVEGSEIAPIHVVETPRGFFVVCDVIGEGESEKPAVLDSIETTKTLYVIREGECGFLMVRRQLLRQVGRCALGVPVRDVTI